MLSIVRSRIQRFRYRIVLIENRLELAKALAFVGWIFIVGGLFGELRASSRIADLSASIQECSDVRLQEARETAGGAYERAAQTEKEAAEDLKTTNIARQKAEEARQKAEGFRAQLVNDEKEAAELRKDAEDEHLARAKIEAAVAWRSLSDQQKRDMGAALASFSQRSGASIWFNGSSTEAEMFADDIAQALRFGHITTTSPGGIMEMRQSGKWNGEIKSVETGVVIQSTKAPAAIEFAEALIKQLNSRGFDAKRQTDPPFDEKTTEPVIWVNVEPRPKGPQGEYKFEAERDTKAKKQQAKTNDAAN